MAGRRRLNNGSERDDPDFLPSFGIGDYVKNENNTRRLLRTIRDTDSGARTSPFSSSGSASSSPPEDDVLISRGPKHVEEENIDEPNGIPMQEGELDQGTSKPCFDIYIEDGQDESILGGNVEIGGDENLYFGRMPNLVVKPVHYTRFRYPSERQDTKKRTRQYETDEEKRYLADIKVTNYEGSATVIVHCVDQDGKLHPYNLFGDSCESGIYMKPFLFGQKTPTLRLNKVSINTPKRNDYQRSQTEQSKMLELYGSNKIPSMDLKKLENKQIVYLRVVVILDDNTQLEIVSLGIHNKKEGEEFKIYCMQPNSVPIDNMDPINNKVLIVVSERTAFPKDIAVIFRQQENGNTIWEETVTSKDLNVIKKAVVEVLPPAYPRDAANSDVMVTVSLVDMATRMETDPVPFIYKLIDDDHVKRKRRKTAHFSGLDSGLSMKTVRRPQEVNQKMDLDPDKSSNRDISLERAKSSQPRVAVAATSAIVTSSSGSFFQSPQKCVPPTGSNLSVEPTTSQAYFQQQQQMQQQLQQQLNQQQQHQLQERSQQQQTKPQLQDMIIDRNLVTSVIPSLQNLPENISLAIINGQLIFVNNDMEDTSPGPAVQNIDGQQVVVQSLPIQHPSSQDGNSDSQAQSAADFTNQALAEIASQKQPQQMQQQQQGLSNPYSNPGSIQASLFGQSSPNVNLGTPSGSQYEATGLAPPQNSETLVGSQDVTFTLNSTDLSAFILSLAGNQVPQSSQQYIPQQNLQQQYSSISTLDDDDLEIDNGSSLEKNTPTEVSKMKIVNGTVVESESTEEGNIKDAEQKIGENVNRKRKSPSNSLKVGNEKESFSGASEVKLRVREKNDDDDIEIG